MAYTRAQAITGFAFGLVHKTTGAAITTGTPVAYITIDGGTQAAATHTPDHEGNGQWTINLNGNETDGNNIGLMITHVDAVSQHFNFITAEVTTTPAVVTVTSSGTSIADTFTYYGTLAAAEHYFTNRLNSDDWDDALVSDRQSALIEATRQIDKLNYSNELYDEDQVLQFPRGDDETVPIEIEYACYEIAIKLLEGHDGELEAQSMGVLTETYTGVRTTYQTGYANEHLRAGIPSISAWEYLKPFLRDQKQVNLLRIN